MWSDTRAISFKGVTVMGNNIVMILLMIIGGSAGIFSTLFILISLPVTIIQKFIRKARYGYKLTD